MNPKPGQDPPPSDVRSPATSSAEQDVTQVIADVENQLLRLKEADSQRRALSAELENREQDLADRELQLAEAAEALKAQQAEDQQHQTQLNDQLTSQIESQQAELEQQRALVDQHTSQAEAIRVQLDEHQSLSSQRDEELASLNAQLESLRTEQSASAEESNARLAEIQTHRELADNSREQAESLQVERDQAVVELTEAKGRAERLTAELQASQGEQSDDVRELAARVEQASQERDRALAELDQLRGQIGVLTLERDALSEQLVLLQGELQAARKAERAKPSTPAASPANNRPPSNRPMPPVRVESRMRRLRGVRTVLFARTRKIRRAGEVLQQRVEQCDLLLVQRRELSAAKRAIDVLHERVEVSLAKINSSIQIAAWVVTLSMLAGLSWVIAGRVAPPSYSANAIISSEVIGTTQGDLAAWSSFHTDLLTHPRLVERVAARLKRRGMTEDASVEAVHAVLDDRLVSRENTPGRLELEIVLEGAGRAERWMETYVTSLVAEANESRPRRRDGLSTVITEPSTIREDPVSDQRPKYAGIGLGISASFAAMVWFGLWKTMARVRKKYEASNRLEEILNEARWVDPVPDVARRSLRG